MAARSSAIILIGFGVFAAGCSALPFRGESRRAAAPPPPPPPLAAAPTGSVSAVPLPPPAADAPPPGGASGLAALSPGSGAPPAGGTPAAESVEVGRTDLLGGWTINAAGDSCQLFMTLTTWSGGYRASTRGCTNPAIQKISAWNLEGRQIQLLDDSNATVARLYAASKTQYNGQTEGGGPVTVTR
jgi:hypothetical protein